MNNYYKNRQGMLDSYAGSDFLARKTAEHEALKTWVNANAARKAEFAGDIEQVEKLIAERDADTKRDFFLGYAQPRLLNTARSLYRLANESTKADTERKSGYQTRDLPRLVVGHHLGRAHLRRKSRQGAGTEQPGQVRRPASRPAPRQL